MVTDMGLSIELGIYSGTIFNIGAFLGIITQGYFSLKLGLQRVISAFMILTCILMTQIQYFIDSDLMLFIFGVLGEKGKIVDVSSKEIPIKLLEMGCLPGNSVKLIQQAPFQGPIYLEINGSYVAIRKETAKLIQIELSK